MEASSAGKQEYGGKGRWVKYWARSGRWISPRCGLFSLGGRFETYEPFIFNFPIFFTGRGKPWILNLWIPGHNCTVISSVPTTLKLLWKGVWCYTEILLTWIWGPKIGLQNSMSWMCIYSIKSLTRCTLSRMYSLFHCMCSTWFECFYTHHQDHKLRSTAIGMRSSVDDKGYK
jgi:hypothetical protein